MASNRILCAERTFFVGDVLDRSQLRERFVKARHEGRVLQPSDDIEVFFAGEIPEIAALFEVAERIKDHDRASRR